MTCDGLLFILDEEVCRLSAHNVRLRAAMSIGMDVCIQDRVSGSNLRLAIACNCAECMMPRRKVIRRRPTLHSSLVRRVKEVHVITQRFSKC